MSWYRTYRPQTIALLHLTVVRTQLGKMMQSGTFPHALLFTGPKGTGKTSSARIIAKIVNCERNETEGAPLQEPCNKCAMCLDITKGRAMNVTEIDAASHRRIDDVRELKEQIYIPPATGKKSVFIIDEVHMMTTEAFNALLKILEEPPAHAIFILATTEFHKLPDTIVSRCTLVQFQKASNDELASALKQIAEKEEVAVDDTVLQLIAQRADGSFRDAVKLFEQLVGTHGKAGLTVDGVQNIFGGSGGEAIAQLVQDVLQKDEQAIIRFFQSQEKMSADPAFIYKELLSYLHTELLKSLGVETGAAISSTAVLQFLLKQLSVIPVDERLPFPLLPLEMTLLEMVLKSKGQGKTGKQENGGTGSPSQESKPKNQAKTQDVAVKNGGRRTDDGGLRTEGEVLQSPYKADTVVPSPIVEPNYHTTDGNKLGQVWATLLEKIHGQNLSLEALLRSSQFIQGETGKVQIKVFYQFHKQQLEREQYLKIVEKCIADLIGGFVRVEYVFEAPNSAVINSPHANISGDVGAVDELVSLAEEALL